MDPSGDATSDLSYVPYKTINTYADIGCVGSTVRFDPYEELLWVGANEGFLHSYQGPYLAQYSGFNTMYGGTVTDFCLTDAGPFVLTTNGMTLHKRDGTTLFNPIISNADSFNCCLAVDKSSTFTSPGTVIVAGNKGAAKKLDMNRPDQPEHLQIAGLETVFLRASDRFLCFGSADGEVGILDLRSNHFRKHRINQTPGVLYDFDVHDYSLFSCMYQTDIHGTILPSYSILAYDLRVCKPTSPITASLSPTLIRFLPNSCGQTCVVADSDGRYQFVDSVATTLDVGKNVYQIDNISAVPFSLDVSPSGHGIAVADAAGFIHVLSSATSKKPLLWNNFSRPSVDVGVIHQIASNDMLLQPNQRLVSSFAIGTGPYNNRKVLTTGFTKSLEAKKHAVVHRSASYVDCSASASGGLFSTTNGSPHKSFEFLALDGMPNKMIPR